VVVNDAGFPAVDIELRLRCPACRARAELSFPLLTDWRERQRLDTLRSCYPSVTCSSCGAKISVPSPVVVLRPGDPVSVIFCVTDRDPACLNTLSDALQQHAVDENGVIPGPIANTDPDLLGTVADRYLGFQLLRLDLADQAWADDERIAIWIAALRAKHPWPDVVGAVNSYLSAGSADGRGVFEREPALSDAMWEPVIRWLGTRTAVGQETADQARTVRERMRRLASLRLFGGEPDLSLPVVKQVTALIEQMTSLQAAPDRSQDDVRRGIDLGRSLIDVATGQYGPDHPVTLTAMNDTAALMLDDAAAAAAMTQEARALLTRVRMSAIRGRSALLADATTNLALAQLRTDRVADADSAEAAIVLLRDAVHLQQLFAPDEPARALSAIGNLAALTRSRLAGDPASNTAAAITLFEAARKLDAGGRLALPDRLTVEANLVSALSDRARQTGGDGNDAEVVAAIERLEPQLAALAPDHPVRIRALTNFGSIALEMLYRGSRALPDGFTERALEWLRDANQNTMRLARDDAVRVLAASTLAAMYFHLGGDENLREARLLLSECVTALADSQATRLHHTVFENLARLHLAQGDWDAAVEVLQMACRHADTVIERAATPATRLAQVAAAGDLYQRLAMLYAHRQDARSAIHTIERARARWRSDKPDAASLDRAVAARLQAGGALLYAGTCGLGSYAVILVAGQGAGAWTTQTTTGDLAPLLAALQDSSETADIARILDAAAGELAAGLVDQAARILRSAGVTRVSIIASGALAGLPLGALPGTDGPLAGQAVVEHLISARPGRERGEPPPAGASTLAIVNPTHDLHFAASELTALRRYASRVLTPPADAGTRGWLLARLPEATHLHLACHARYEPSDPFASRFILGDRLAVTVADLAEVSTPNLSMVVASCCQSGVVDQRGADELVGLAQALIAAGAASALAALWEITDAGTSLLIAKFYDELAQGMPPPVAITNAQHHLRETTMGEWLMLAQADDGESWVPEDLRRELRALSLHPDFRNRNARPFAHPAHWAGVVYISALWRSRTPLRASIGRGLTSNRG
jgi:CHAT domain-containing protein